MPAPAARALERALALGLPQSLREDARARLVEAQARSGNTAAARDAAAAYRREFPDGRYRARIESQLP
jgi:transmembrane sensor